MNFYSNCGLWPQKEMNMPILIHRILKKRLENASTIGQDGTEHYLNTFDKGTHLIS